MGFAFIFSFPEKEAVKYFYNNENPAYNSSTWQPQLFLKNR